PECHSLPTGLSSSPAARARFFLPIRRPPRSPLFPYTTLFRSRRSRRAALRPPTEPAGCAAHARSQSGRKAVPQQASGDDAACSPPHWDAVEWLAPSRTDARGHPRTPLVRDLSGYRRENPAGPDSSPILGRDNAATSQVSVTSRLRARGGTS